MRRACAFASARQRAEDGDKFSLLRAIRAMVNDGVSGGIEQEISLRNSSVMLGRHHDPFHLQLRPEDLGWHQRTAMQVGTGSMGGYMVPTEPTAFAALADVSALVRAGASVWTGIPTGTQALPGFASNTTASWYSESGTATASDPTLSAITATPKRCVAVTSISRQLLVQSPVAEALLNRHLLTAVGKALDAAGLAGTSGSTNPTGAPYLTGLGTSVLGTGYSGSTGFALVQKVAESATDDSRIVAIAPPSVRALLSGRNVGTNVNVPIWQNAMVSGVPGIVSANALANSIVYADWSHTQVIVWGLELSANPYSATGFMSDIVQVKATLFADIAYGYPQTVCVGTGLT